MAGLLDRFTKQVLHKKPKTMSQTANRRPVVVMPVKPVAPVVGPEKVTTSEGVVTKEQVATLEEVATVEDGFASEKGVTPEELAALLEPVEKVKVSVNSIMEREMTTENIIVENVPENKSIEKEDYLLAQIDEFRAKAQMLQTLMLTKESKVQELQEIVDEREVKAKELEHLLGERQRKADGITEEVARQIDSLIDKVTEKMEAIGVSLGKELQDGQKINERQLEELKDTLGVLNGQQLEEIKGALGSLSEQQAEDLRNVLTELNSQLEVVKSDLSDKVHSENVQCYRNLADLLKSVESKLDKANELEKKVDAVHKCTKTIIVLGVINMIGLLGLALYELGIFQLLMK